MTAQVAADLRAAADILERDGWTQGDLGECGGPKRLVGVAYYVASDGTEVLFERSGAAIHRAETSIKAFAAHVRVERAEIPTWNDTPGRTADEVIAALRAAADTVEQADTHRADGQR